MPRNASKDPKIQCTFMIRPETLKEIDRLAEKYDLTRSQFISNLLENALDQAKVMDKYGMFAAVRFGESIYKKINEALFSGHMILDKNGELKIIK